ncbi:hypothetical protein QYF36_014859 [Acer negundo]|nr:hypothetical protein QYF36_014859 [Acer negundo]
MRETVTIQLGGFANFIGSHFWNFQDELLGLASDPESDPVFKNPYRNATGTADKSKESNASEKQNLVSNPRNNVSEEVRDSYGPWI